MVIVNNQQKLAADTGTFNTGDGKVLCEFGFQSCNHSVSEILSIRSAVITQVIREHQVIYSYSILQGTS